MDDKEIADNGLPVHREIEKDPDGPGFFVEGIDGGPFSEVHAKRLQHMRTDGSNVNELDVEHRGDEPEAGTDDVSEPGTATARETAWMSSMEKELDELHEKYDELKASFDSFTEAHAAAANNPPDAPTT